MKDLDGLGKPPVPLDDSVLVGPNNLALVLWYARRLRETSRKKNIRIWSNGNGRYFLYDPADGPIT